MPLEQYYQCFKMHILPKKFVFIVYDNGFIKPYKWFKEGDKLIETFDGKAIVKDDNHAYISEKGIRYYFVRNTDERTTFKLWNNQKYKHPELDRETIFSIHHNKLLRTMHNVVNTSLMSILLWVLVGAGVGYMIADSYGNNDTFIENNQEENYYPTDSGENKTVIIGMIQFNEGLQWEKINIPIWTTNDLLTTKLQTLKT